MTESSVTLGEVSDRWLGLKEASRLPEGGRWLAGQRMGLVVVS